MEKKLMFDAYNVKVKKIKAADYKEFYIKAAEYVRSVT